MLTFSSFFNEIGQIKKAVYPSRTGGFSKVRNDILFLKNVVYIYYYFDLRRATCSNCVILLYFELSKSFHINFNIFEKYSKYHYTYI